ncbi:MAG: monovalent cation/H(+) antiporter subunit G [Candidatus Cryosericum sp.]
MQLVAGYLLLYLGAFFLLVSSIGLLRLPDVYTRMQAATKSTTLGVFFSVVGVGVLHPAWLLECLAVAFFILLTAPISGSALLRASYKAGSPMTSATVVDKTPEFLKGGEK